jgi:hypothetical protein
MQHTTESYMDPYPLQRLEGWQGSSAIVGWVVDVVKDTNLIADHLTLLEYRTPCILYAVQTCCEGTTWHAANPE